MTVNASLNLPRWTQDAPADYRPCPRHLVGKRHRPRTCWCLEFQDGLYLTDHGRRRPGEVVWSPYGWVLDDPRWAGQIDRLVRHAADDGLEVVLRPLSTYNLGSSIDIAFRPAEHRP